jgi:hypothetical protein
MKKFAVAVILAALSFSAAAYTFSLVRVEPSNGGNVCVYSNGSHDVKVFRPYSAGYCPFNMER